MESKDVVQSTSLAQEDISSCEFVLADLIDDICRRLNIKDLSSVAQVCRAWNEAAKREIHRRGSLQRIILYENFNTPFLEILNAKPYIAVFFVYQDFEAEEPREIIICQQFMKQFPEIVVAVGAYSVFTENNIIMTEEYDEDESFRMHSPNQFPCLIIPKHDKLEIKYSWYTRTQLKSQTANRAESIINELAPKNKDFKTVLMMFTFGSDHVFIKNLMKSIKKCFNKGSYALWGGELFFMPFLFKCKEDQIGDEQQRQIGFLGISISSPYIETYSTVMYCEKMQISKIHQELENFKNTVKLKSHSMALINGPLFEGNYIDTSDEEESKHFRILFDDFYTEDYEKCFLYHFKKFFPDVELISTFRDNMFKTFGIDSMNASNPDLDHDQALSILIITYK